MSAASTPAVDREAGATEQLTRPHALTPPLPAPLRPPGASSDFQQVSRTARLMVTQLGFSKLLGQVAWSSGGGNAFLGQSAGQPSDFSSQARARRRPHAGSGLALCCVAPSPVALSGPAYPNPTKPPYHRPLT